MCQLLLDAAIRAQTHELRLRRALCALLLELSCRKEVQLLAVLPFAGLSARCRSKIFLAELAVDQKVEESRIASQSSSLDSSKDKLMESSSSEAVVQSSSSSRAGVAAITLANRKSSSAGIYYGDIPEALLRDD